MNIFRKKSLIFLVLLAIVAILVLVVCLVNRNNNRVALKNYNVKSSYTHSAGVVQDDEEKINALLKEVYDENLIGKEYEREIIETIKQRLHTAREFNRRDNVKNEDPFFNDSNNKQDAFEKIYNSNYWESGESKSGGGSHIESTQNIRAALPEIWKKYSVRSFLDVPCGDYNWMKEVNKTGIKYIGGDIVSKIIEVNNKNYKSSNISFEVIDITSSQIPKVDMIFCKDCLQHLSYENIKKAIRNFKNSGSTYLFITSYPLTLENHDIIDGGYHPLNLFKEPFNFPASSCLEKVVEKKSLGNEIDKTMYLFKLADIQF